MTPFLAQGAVMAIEDGMVLARAFQAATDWREGLSRYEAARRDRGTLVMWTAVINSRWQPEAGDNYLDVRRKGRA